MLISNMIAKAIFYTVWRINVRDWSEQQDANTLGIEVKYNAYLLYTELK